MTAPTNIETCGLNIIGESDLELLLHGCDMATWTPHDSTARSQNVPKTKVERAKLVEITEDRKKVLIADNID
jgi:hypothetical protein